ncbi:MAG: glycosyl transferase, partial [Chitinophagaceae bacterium]
MKNSCFLFLLAFVIPFHVFADGGINIHINQVGFNTGQPKYAVIETENNLGARLLFHLDETLSGKPAYQSFAGEPTQVNEWRPGHFFYRADFSELNTTGEFRLVVETPAGAKAVSSSFRIGDQFLTRTSISAILQYFRHQRAVTAAEWDADSAVVLYGSDKTANVRGGWCDASGDVSKYFSHLAYTNYMMPQQTPLVTWSLVNTAEAIPALISEWQLTDSLRAEAYWGADYMMRSLSDEGYFYMTVFSYFDKNPKARRIAGLLANSVTTSDYQCAFREGGGMAIAALARISQWKSQGDYLPSQYLQAAERAYAHLVSNNKKYCDDGIENIIDDYCALMAATELWIATDSVYYRDQSRMRAKHLGERFTDKGWFRSDGGNRPFWHASDAGMPIRALERYLEKESDKDIALQTSSWIMYWFTMAGIIDTQVPNPFNYPRQLFRMGNTIRSGFFVPHENESGWWWQGE